MVQGGKCEERSGKCEVRVQGSGFRVQDAPADPILPSPILPLSHSPTLPGPAALPGTTDARRRLVPWQGVVLAAGALLVAWGLARGARPVLQATALAWMACYWFNTLYRAWIVIESALALRAGAAFPPCPALPADADCPTYTLLLPLYREAAVVGDLARCILSLDYPRDRLQVLCLLRPDDHETRAALDALSLPAYFRVLLLPPDLPVGTKPAACNYGLAHATGEILVIFDAEDRPEPLQLRKAAASLRDAPADVAVVQTPKAVYNGDRSLISRIYELEALTWHRLFLTGFAACEGFAPLHGSGAHFRTAVLHAVGGFDYYNVTEDCDLGVRLYRLGMRILLFDSVTGEEAPPTLRGWLRQRTRWNKGYLQSLFVHTRDPLRLARILGFRKSVAFASLLPIALVNVLAGAPACAGTYLWIVVRSGSADQMARALLASGTALGIVSVLLFGAGAVATRKWRCLIYVLFVPFYWVLLAVAAYRAVWQFAIAPFGWEKTAHGGRRA